MNYKLKCPHCGHITFYSSHDAVEFLSDKKNSLSWDCEKCGEELLADYVYRGRKIHSGRDF